MRARANAPMHARTHTRTHAHMHTLQHSLTHAHTHTHTHRCVGNMLLLLTQWNHTPNLNSPDIHATRTSLRCMFPHRFLFLLKQTARFVDGCAGKTNGTLQHKEQYRHHLECTSVSYITVNEDYVYFRCLELNAVLCKFNLITRYLVYFCNGNTEIN